MYPGFSLEFDGVTRPQVVLANAVPGAYKFPSVNGKKIHGIHLNVRTQYTRRCSVQMFVYLLSYMLSLI
jgi:hypothetical protein